VLRVLLLFRIMTSVLSVQTRTRPLEVGQYVRLKRAPYKDDLAKVHDIINHGEKVMHLLFNLL
jgi:hypothetical protein